jgi:hypothetical protein
MYLPEYVVYKPKNDYWPDKQPSDWLLNRVYISQMTSFKEIDVDSYHNAVIELPFIYNHVGGSGKSSPPRGVCVVGGKEKVSKTWWTASQNNNNITLESETRSYPQEIKQIVPVLISQLGKFFPDAPISEDTFSLAVANHYQIGTRNKIAPHTDDQPWYASPPVFASITTFPEGEPKDYRSTFRFQVLDEGYETPTYINLFLKHSTICLMRADVTHRVLPPLKKFANHKIRYNLTFRNLVSSKSDPLGYIMAMSNHYRYYGKPVRLIIPLKVESPNLLFERYKSLNSDMTVTKTKIAKDQKKKARSSVIKYYARNSLVLNLKMLNKSNVTLKCLEWALERG